MKSVSSQSGSPLKILPAKPETPSGNTRKAASGQPPGTEARSLVRGGTLFALHEVFSDAGRAAHPLLFLLVIIGLIFVYRGRMGSFDAGDLGL